MEEGIIATEGTDGGGYGCPQVMMPSTQPASSSRPQPQQSKGMHPSRERGISRNALLL